jgi:GDPmannose 4,6-dehydratase
VRALVTGIAGQDGSYLAEQLLGAGHEVHGVVRGDVGDPQPNLDAVRDRIELHADGVFAELLRDVRPQRVFHLAAPTFVPDSWIHPAETFAAVAQRGAELLEAVAALDPQIRVVLAGSREMFGDAAESPQRETTRCAPANPYGVAKLAQFELTRVLRRRHDLHASTAILYNHESPRRPERFVTRRVTRGVARIKLGLAEQLVLGDLDAVRDWSSATDVVRGMRLMAEQAEPGDYVLASGVGRTVRELVDVAFEVADLDPEGRVAVDGELRRAPELNAAVGDPGRAREQLGWVPEQSFRELIDEMLARDLAELSATAA